LNSNRSRKWFVIVFVVALSTLAFSALDSRGDDAKSDEWKAPARAARKKNPIPADDKSSAAGRDVYVKQCLSCHGETGKGDGTAAKDLDPKPKDLSSPDVQSQSDGTLFWKITTGKKPMPTFEKLTSEDDRWNVVNYIRTLAPTPAKAPASQPAQ